MNYLLLNKLNTEVPLLKNKYYKQLFIYESKLGNSLEKFSIDQNIPYLNLNVLLSELLQNVDMNRRPYRAAELVDNLIMNEDGEIVCIDYYELLFEPSLKLNPFETFKSISRKKTLLIAWRGNIQNDYLIHAEPGHPEYMKVRITDAVLIH